MLKSIGVKMTVVVISSSVLLLAILGLMLNYQVQQTISPITTEMGQEIVSARADEINKWMQARVDEVSALSGDKRIINALASEDWASAKEYVNEQGSNYKNDFYFVWYADLQGNFYTSTGATGNVGERYDFKAIKEGGKSVFISNALIAKATGKPVIVILHEVRDSSNRLVGAFAGTIGMETLTQIAKGVQITGEDSQGLIADNTGLVIAHSDEQYTMKLNLEEADKSGFKGLSKIREQMITGDKGVGKFYSPSGAQEVLFYNKLLPSLTNWYLGVSVPIKFLLRDANNLVYTILIGLLAVLAVMVVVSILLAKDITKPILRIVKHLKTLAKGDFSTLIDNQMLKRKDELGTLALATDDMQSSIKGMVEEVLKSSESLNNHSQDLNRISDEARMGSEQISQTMQQLSSGVAEQARSSSEINDYIKNLTELIFKTNDNGEKLRMSANNVLSASSEGGAQMDESVSKMEIINNIVKESVEKVKGLDNKAQQITKLVEVINSIATQTNLLALNAAIEAARAGEHGKGFTVVAEEVRKLAEQVGRSISEITNIVQGIQEESRAVLGTLEEGFNNVEDGTKQITLTGKTFKNINFEVEDMVQKIQEVANNLQAVTKDSNVINNSAQQVASIAQESSAGIEETVASLQQQNSSMETVANSANVLADLAKNLKEESKKFKI